MNEFEQQIDVFVIFGILQQVLARLAQIGNAFVSPAHTA
jgi:hypothetical protein